LAKAQQGVADARVQAAERIKEAQKAVGEAEQNLAKVVEDSAQRQKDAQQQVRDAEKDLRDAQLDAVQAQASLTDARREAVRTLADMNDRLAGSQLDEREAVMRQAEAEKALRAAQANPGVTPEQLAKLQLAYDRAALNLKEQRRETKELATDTAKANKAGVEGSTQVTQAKDRIAQANQTVVDRERDLTKAREDQRRTAVQSARDIADAQQQVADAQAGVAKARSEGARQIRDAEQAVADAAQAVADAQAAAAAQTSAYAQAMAKLAPNAQSFVRAVQGLAPAWDAMKMSVQNRLFEGLDTTVTQLGNATIPILQRRLTETAGVWNAIAKNAAGAVQQMAKSGQLDQILAGATKNLAVFQKVPGQLITAFGQLTVAAQPAFNGLLNQFAGAITSFTDGIAASFQSGGLQDAIDTAFGILSSFGTLLGNALGVVTEIFKAASDAGGQIVGVLGTVLGEVKTILAGPEIQGALRQLFTSVGQIVTALVPVFGSVVQAIVPLLAAIAPFIAQLAQALGPVLQDLVTALGSALMPIIQSLMPVITQVGLALIQIVGAVTPLLQPIGYLISTIISALAPALTPIINIITELVNQLIGPLTTVVRGLTPLFTMLGDIIGQVFGALEPLLTPLVDLIGQVAGMIAGALSKALQQWMAAIQPLIPIGLQLINQVIGALTPVLPILGKALGTVASALVQLMAPMGQVASQMAQTLGPIIEKMAPVIGNLAMTIATALMSILPPLLQALVTLAPAFSQIELLVIQLGVGIFADLMPSMSQLITAAVQLVVALVPILPPLAQIIALVVQLAVQVLSVLLPPLLKLVTFFIKNFSTSLSTAISWISNIIGWFQRMAGWIGEKLGPKIKWLYERVVRPAWAGIKAAIGASWDRIRPIFDTLKNAVGKVGDAFEKARKAIKSAWDKLEGIAKKPVSFVINTVYNRGIVGVWNKVATAFGADKLPEYHPKGFATGGVLPGYTPGRDPHKFYSSTGGALELSGGEAIMRPEFTRAVGSNFVGYFNQLARTGGTSRVRRELAPLLGGNPPMPTDRSLRYANGGVVQRFAGGGIFGWIGKAKNAIAGAGSEIWNKVKEGAAWLKDGLANSAKAGIKVAVDPLLKRFPGMDTALGRMLRRIPTHMVDSLVGYSKTSDKKGGGGGLGGPRIQAALKWAKSQNGKKYQWAGNGNPSWDCSGFMSAIESVIRGQKPHRRWATMAFSGKTAPPGWVYQGNSPFRIGITNAGVGHTAGTLGKTNVESSGGLGVHYGKTARGYRDKMFTSWYGFQPGKYDQGGFIQPGFSTVYNGTGRPEPVLTGAQWNSVMSDRQNLGDLHVAVYVGDREITDIARAEVHTAQGELVRTLYAS
ncbi:MAG: hypothetical protein LBV34_12615, partial [Nocardiopsaceae bacterium]|nr:hypothetical protein [Nocardiopsaceae bacterium]